MEEVADAEGEVVEREGDTQETVEGDNATEEVVGDTEQEEDPETESGQIRSERLKKQNERPRRNTVVQYALRDGHIHKAKVLFSQPKKGGQHSNWVNVQLIGSEEKSLQLIGHIFYGGEKWMTMLVKYCH